MHPEHLRGLTTYLSAVALDLIFIAVGLEREAALRALVMSEVVDDTADWVKDNSSALEKGDEWALHELENRWLRIKPFADALSENVSRWSKWHSHETANDVDINFDDDNQNDQDPTQRNRPKLAQPARPAAVVID